MSISDMIVVMKAGVVQQIGQPQSVYDEPVNLFVAKFLGTPPINVFDAKVENGFVTIGKDRVLPVSGVADGKYACAIRPEGFVPNENGALQCSLKAVEVMGRDTSVVFGHEGVLSETPRAIISADARHGIAGNTVRFSVKPHKLFLFDAQTEARVPFTAREV